MELVNIDIVGLQMLKAPFTGFLYTLAYRSLIEIVRVERVILVAGQRSDFGR